MSEGDSLQGRFFILLETDSSQNFDLYVVLRLRERFLRPPQLHTRRERERERERERDRER